MIIEMILALYAFLPSDHPAYEPHRAEVLAFMGSGWQQELVGHARAGAQYSPADLELSCGDARAEIQVGLPQPHTTGGWVAPVAVRAFTQDAFEATCSVAHDGELLGSIAVTVESECLECEYPEP